MGKISRLQLDRAPIRFETFPKLGNQGVSSDMATLISKTGHLYLFLWLSVTEVNLCGRDSRIARGIDPRVLM